MEGNAQDFSDGELADMGGSWGVGLGGGSINLVAEYRRHHRTNRASFDPRDQVAAGDAGSNAVAQPNHRWGDPDTQDAMTYVNASVPLNRAGDTFPLWFRRLQPARGEQRGLLSPRAGRAQLAADLSARLPAHDPTDGGGRVGGRGPGRVPPVDLRRERPMRAQQLCVHDWRLVERVARSGHANKATFEAGTLGR